MAMEGDATLPAVRRGLCPANSIIGTRLRKRFGTRYSIEGCTIGWKRRQRYFDSRDCHILMGTIPAEKKEYFIFLRKVLGWCVPGLSGPPTWTPPPFIISGPIQLFFGFFLLHVLFLYDSCTKLRHTRSQLMMKRSVTHHQPSSAQQRTAALAQ